MPTGAAVSGWWDGAAPHQPATSVCCLTSASAAPGVNVAADIAAGDSFARRSGERHFGSQNGGAAPPCHYLKTSGKRRHGEKGCQALPAVPAVPALPAVRSPRTIITGAVARVLRACYSYAMRRFFLRMCVCDAVFPARSHVPRPKKDRDILVTSVQDLSSVKKPRSQNRKPTWF